MSASKENFDVDDIYQYIYKFEVNNTDLYITVTNSGQIKIGSRSQLKRAHMPQMPLWDYAKDSWISTYGDFNEPIFIHLTIKDQALWCNLGPELLPGDNDYPYLFMNKLRYLAIIKRAKEIEVKHDERLREKYTDGF